MKTHGPWKISNTTIKYKNPWLSVREDEVIRPDGKPGIFGVVEMVPGASVLPIDENGNVYLTREFRYAIGEDSVEVVSGGIEKGETALAAAKRELEEELGFVAEEWVDLGKMNPFTSAILSPANLFLAKRLTTTKINHDSTEIITPIAMPLKQAVEMVMNSKISHGQTSVLILKAYYYLNNLKKVM
jgi:ADP-ribose pyrophosphatase